MRFEIEDPGYAQSPDLDDEAVRRRLGPSALTGFRRIMDAWQVSQVEARQLFATEGDMDSLDPLELGKEQLERTGYLIGIYRILHTVLNGRDSDHWVRRPNHDPMFGGKTPLAYMVGGGVDGLRKVRSLLEAVGQGR